VEAALAVLGNEGVEALTMQRLAGDLGYAVGALYRYFPSKDHILVAVERQVLGEVAQELGAALEAMDAHLGRSRADAREAALARLCVAARLYADPPTRRSTEFRLLSVAIADPRELVESEAALGLLPAVGEVLSRVRAVIEAAARAGALSEGDADRRAVLLWAGLQGTLQLRKLGRFGLPGLDVDALVTDMLHGLLVGWGADPDVVTDADRRAQRVLDRGAS